jgi:hypothetical protein
MNKQVILKDLKEAENQTWEQIGILEELYELEQELNAKYRQVAMEILTSDSVIGLPNQTLRDAEYENIILNNDNYATIYKDYLKIKGKIRYETRVLEFYKDVMKNRRLELSIE